MEFLTKRSLIALIGCAFLLVLSACGTGQQYTTGSSSTSSSNGSSSSAAATPTPDTFGVKIAQVSVKGKTEPVLTDDRGMTLYTFKPDTATTTACTGKCAVTWPPQLAKQTGETKFDNIGTLSAVKDANGIQVQANTHFLYTFSKDTAPGQANGEGVAGKWFVATPTK